MCPQSIGHVVRGPAAQALRLSLGAYRNGWVLSHMG